MTNIKQITPDFQSPLLIFYFASSFPVIASPFLIVIAGEAEQSPVSFRH